MVLYDLERHLVSINLKTLLMISLAIAMMSYINQFSVIFNIEYQYEDLWLVLSEWNNDNGPSSGWFFGSVELNSEVWES